MQNTKTPGDRAAALKRFMESRGLKAHPWATAAGLRSSTLYNFLSGKSQSLSSESLERLAQAAGATVDEILSGETTAKVVAQGTVWMRYTVGVFGRLFAMDSPTQIARPSGVPQDVDVIAARIDGDGLHPIPNGWTVFYEALERDPETLVGKLCVVKTPTAPLQIREIRRGTQRGLYTLLAWSASPVEDVQVTAAHLVISISQLAT